MVDISLTYNVIFGRPVLNYHRGIVINMGAMFLKLLALGGLAVVRDSQKLAHECYKHSTKSFRKETISINLLEKLDSHMKAELEDPIEEVQLETDKRYALELH